MFSVIKDIKIVFAIRKQTNDSLENCLEKLKSERAEACRKAYEKGHAKAVEQCQKPEHYQRALAKARQQGFDNGFIHGRIAARATANDYVLTDEYY